MASTLKIPMSSKILIHTYLIKSTLGDLKIKAFNFVFIMKNKLIVNGSWNAKIMLFFKFSQINKKEKKTFPPKKFDTEIKEKFYLKHLRVLITWILSMMWLDNVIYTQIHIMQYILRKKFNFIYEST